MQRVNSESSAWVTATYRDRQGVPGIPVSATYRIDCLTTKRPVRGLTALPTGQAVSDIQLTAQDTAIISKTNPSEIKRVTVVAVYSAPDDQVTGQYDFEVVNVPFA